MNFEFEDVLKEYQKIEEELNGEDSDEQDQPNEYLEISNQVKSYFIQSRMGRPEKQGLLSQYIEARMSQ